MKNILRGLDPQVIFIYFVLYLVFATNGFSSAWIILIRNIYIQLSLKNV